MQATPCPCWSLQTDESLGAPLLWWPGLTTQCLNPVAECSALSFLNRLPIATVTSIPSLWLPPTRSVFTLTPPEVLSEVINRRGSMAFWIVSITVVLEDLVEITCQFLTCKSWAVFSGYQSCPRVTRHGSGAYQLLSAVRDPSRLSKWAIVRQELSGAPRVCQCLSVWPLLLDGSLESWNPT